MDATYFTGRADSKRDLRLGHDSVRHLCQRQSRFDQYLYFSADGACVGSSIYFVRINRRSDFRYCRPLRRLCADAQQAVGQHHGNWRAGQQHFELSHQYRRRDLFRLILHHQCAEYGGQSHNDRDSHRLSRTHGQHGPHRHRVGLFAAFAIPVYRRALQRGRNRRADGWYEGTHFGQGKAA